MKTGLIGLGGMGLPMATNLHKHGHLVGVWNRTTVKAETFARETGVPVMESPTALAAACELIITCVSRDEDVKSVIDALLPGLATNTIIVDTSTVSSETARWAADKVSAKSASFLDCPVSGGVEGARNAILAMMVGGDPAVLERARPVLSSIAAIIVHMGPTGSGQATKAVNQIMAAGINQAVTEALAFGEAMGLDMDKVIEVVGSGAAANWFLNKRGKTMLAHQFTPGFKLALHHKDLRICQAMAAQKTAHPQAVIDLTLQNYEQLMVAGHGEEDISALFRLKQADFRASAEDLDLPGC